MISQRRDLVLSNSTGVLRPYSGASVTVTCPGAKVSAGSSGTTISVYSGHGFRNGDKILVQSTSDYRTVNADPTATSISVSVATTVVSGDVLLNLGSDTGSSSPNWDGSRVVIWNNPDGSSAVSNSTVTTNSEGEYSYYHSLSSAWEIFRTDSTVLDVNRGIAPSDVVNVRDFGAKGDGTTNDTAPVNAAASAAAAISGALYFPSGNFVCDNVNVPDGVTAISGPGWIYDTSGTSTYDALLTLGGSTCLTGVGTLVDYIDIQVNLLVANAATVRGIACRCLRNSRIRDSVIRWTATPTTTVEHYGIYLSNLSGTGSSSDLSISNNEFTFPIMGYGTTMTAFVAVSDSTAYGGYFSGGGTVNEPANPVRRVTVTGNRIYGGSHGITFNGAVGCNITGNVMYAMKQRGIVMEPACFYNTVTGNTIFDGSSGIIFAYGAKFNLVASNMLYSTDETGEGAILFYLGCESNVIASNLTRSGALYGIYLGPGSRRNAVMANTVGHFREAGIAIDGDWRTTLPGGALHSRSTTTAPPSPYTNWGFSSAEFNVISGNVVERGRSSSDTNCALYLGQLNGEDGTTQLAVSNNDILGNVVYLEGTFTDSFVVVFEEQAGRCVSNSLRNNACNGVATTNVSWTQYRAHFRDVTGNEGIDTSTSQALTANSTTPNVAYGGHYETANSSSTTITDFLGGINGQNILVRFDVNTGITHDNTKIKLRGAANIAVGALSANSLIGFRRLANVWFETWRNF